MAQTDPKMGLSGWHRASPLLLGARLPHPHSKGGEYTDTDGQTLTRAVLDEEGEGVSPLGRIFHSSRSSPQAAVAGGVGLVPPGTR